MQESEDKTILYTVVTKKMFVLHMLFVLICYINDFPMWQFGQLANTSATKFEFEGSKPGSSCHLCSLYLAP